MFNMTEGVVIKNGFAQLNNREGSLLYIKNITHKNVVLNKGHTNNIIDMSFNNVHMKLFLCHFR